MEKPIFQFVAEHGTPTDDPFTFVMPSGVYSIITNEQGVPVVTEFIPAGYGPN